MPVQPDPPGRHQRPDRGAARRGDGAGDHRQLGRRRAGRRRRSGARTSPSSPGKPANIAVQPVPGQPDRRRRSTTPSAWRSPGRARCAWPTASAACTRSATRTAPTPARPARPTRWPEPRPTAAGRALRSHGRGPRLADLKRGVTSPNDPHRSGSNDCSRSRCPRRVRPAASRSPRICPRTSTTPHRPRQAGSYRRRRRGREAMGVRLGSPEHSSATDVGSLRRAR